MLGLVWRFFPTPFLIIRLATFAIGIVYPTFNSFLAVESQSADDDKQWLTYWVVICTLQVVERLLWIVLAWVPLYSVLRLVLVTWLSHPQFKGATLTYDLAIRPLLVEAATMAKDYPTVAKYSKPFLEGPIPTEKPKKKLGLFQKKVEKPVVEPVPEPTPEPVAEPVPEPTPAPVPEPAPAPVLFPEAAAQVASSHFADVGESNLSALAGKSS